MDDVYISDPRQASAQVIAKKQKDRRNSLKRRNFGQYLFDLIVKTLICCSLITIDFTLFAGAGSYNLFKINQMPTTEALYICAGISAICFLVILLFSFSAFLQNIFIAVSFAALVLAIFNQFALFDQNSILYGIFAPYLDSGISGIFLNYSDWLIAGLVALLSLIIISYTSRSNQIYLLGTLLLILGGIISEAYFNPLTRNFDDKKALQNVSSGKDGRNFVFLAFPNFGSYSDIKEAENKNYTVNQIADNLLGFYAVNNFVHYPNAYVSRHSNDFVNLVETFNPESGEKLEDNLLENVMLASFWNFKNLDTDKLYLKNNALYEHLSKQKYTLKAFQTRGLELCSINNNLAVGKCVEKINYPINLDQPGLSDLDKTILLTAQWLQSTKIVSNINLPLLAASYLTREIAPLNFAGTELYPVNSFKILDLIINDIKSSKENNAYIAVIDLPSSTYVYDDYCNLKNPFQWSSAKPQPWSKSKVSNNKQQAYAEQTNCLIGQLENFIQELKRIGKLDDTVIIMQGISPSGVFMNKTKNLQDFQRVGLAVYQPEQKPQTKYDLCPASQIISGILNKNGKCKELSGQNTTDKRRKEILDEAHKKLFTEQRLSNSTRRFKEWYQTFAGHNNYENMLMISDADAPSEKISAPETEDKAKEVKKVSATAVAEELPAEKKAKSISKAMQETAAADYVEEQKAAAKEKKAAKADTDNDTVIPLTKPEQLKKEYKEKIKAQKKKLAEKPKEAKVEIKVNVLENPNAPLDVVPPALLGETQYKPAAAE